MRTTAERMFAIYRRFGPLDAYDYGANRAVHEAIGPGSSRILEFSDGSEALLTSTGFHVLNYGAMIEGAAE